jgi:hypothetical protein
MTHARKCPSCGRIYRVPENRLGKKLRCAVCENIFVLSPSEAIAESSSPPTGKADKTLRPKFFFWKRLGDPAAAVEGSIPGAISGVVAGSLGAFLAGIFSGEAAGEIIGSVLTGFVIGFGVGAVLGGILGAVRQRLRRDSRVEPGFTLFFWGAVIGSVVAVFVESFRWIPLGAGLGAVGASLWPLFCRRVEAAVNPPPGETSGEDLYRGTAEGTDHRHIIQESSHLPRE